MNESSLLLFYGLYLWLQVLQLPWFFFKLGFTPCKAEQPLQGMELQEKEVQKD